MSLILQNTPESKEDIAESYVYYGLENQALADRFLQALADVEDLICRMPYVGQLHRGRIRRKALPIFPFTVFYMVEGPQLLILAVWHQHRNPADLNDRLAPFA